VDRLALAGATAAMKDKEYFKETTKKIIATREATMAKLTELGFNVLPSAANFVFASHPTVDAKELYEQLHEQNILIRYFSTSSIENYVRISIETDQEMEQFIQAVKMIIE